MIIRLLIRLLLLGFFAYLLYSFWRYLLAALTRTDSSVEPETPRVEPMVLDPECGTHIPLSDALCRIIDGKRYHFCSRECRDAYCSRH